jgi:HSP20 family molecular chaperone IbpA
MDYDYSKRGYLLPEGCKDLVDLIQPKTTITAHAFVVTVRLPDLRNKDIDVTVEGNTLRIVTKQGGSHRPFESVVDVPADFALADARATYFQGLLRIVVPKRAPYIMRSRF